MASIYKRNLDLAALVALVLLVACGTDPADSGQPEASGPSVPDPVPSGAGAAAAPPLATETGAPIPPPAAPEGGAEPSGAPATVVPPPGMGPPSGASEEAPTSVAPTAPAELPTPPAPMAVPTGSTLPAQGAEEDTGAPVPSMPRVDGGAPPAEPSQAEADSPFPPGTDRPRLMIVGDSISAGPGCYKGLLDAKLKAAGYSNYEFVGAYADDCGSGVRHSAVSCSTAQQYTTDQFTLSNCSPPGPYDGMARLVATHQPDLVMLQLGVNDLWGGGTPVASLLARYQVLIEQARASNPSIVILVAQLHRFHTLSACSDAVQPDAKAQELVEAIPAWVLTVTTAVSPVLAADLWTNSSVSDTRDCVHPNEMGDQRMADNWFEALSGVLR